MKHVEVSSWSRCLVRSSCSLLCPRGLQGTKLRPRPPLELQDAFSMEQVAQTHTQQREWSASLTFSSGWEGQEKPLWGRKLACVCGGAGDVLCVCLCEASAAFPRCSPQTVRLDMHIIHLPLRELPCSVTSDGSGVGGSRDASCWHKIILCLISNLELHLYGKYFNIVDVLNSWCNGEKTQSANCPLWSKGVDFKVPFTAQSGDFEQELTG